MVNVYSRHETDMGSIPIPPTNIIDFLQRQKLFL